MIIPYEFHELFTQLKIFWAACHIWFGDGSVIEFQLRELVRQTQIHDDLFKRSIYEDPDFSPKFLYKIDCRIQLFLTKCRRAETRDETFEQILDIHKVIEDILTKSFICILPATFT